MGQIFANLVAIEVLLVYYYVRPVLLHFCSSLSPETKIGWCRVSYTAAAVAGRKDATSNYCLGMILYLRVVVISPWYIFVRPNHNL